MGRPTTAVSSPRCSIRRWYRPIGTGLPPVRKKAASAVCCAAVASAPPANEMGGIRFEADGAVTIITGTLDYGQGHWTPFAQILHQQLGVPFDRIRLLQGDSDELIAGGGTGGSKSLMASGAAIVGASEKVIEQGRQIAAHALEAAVADVEFSRGRFVIAGTDRFIEIMELATMIRRGLQLPPELPQTLGVQHIHVSSPSAFPNGVHIAEVEVDPETGVVVVVKYSMVNDFGVIVNPLLVAGQAHGGVVQGIGQALMERTVFDEEGQFLTGSFTDYALPRASDAVMFAIDSHPVPAKTNPLGAKGCGEAGCAGSLPAVITRSSMPCQNTASATSTCRRRHSGSGRRSRRPAEPARAGHTPGRPGPGASVRSKSRLRRAPALPPPGRGPFPPGG
jgi:aerobic carbon-monoxide dehydrogenase large subunit